MRNRLSVKPPKKRISRPRRGARGLKIRNCLEQGKAATLSSLPQAGDGGTDRCAAACSCPRRTVGQPDLPSGLMVFSAASFSLEPPLDMSAAMEKALAREESCGLGDAVNSMAPSVRSWPRTGPAELPSSFPKGDKNQHRAQSFQLQSQRSRELQMSQPRPDKSSPLASVPHCKALQPQRLPTSQRGQERTSLGLHRVREPWGAPQDHRLRRRKLEMSIGRAKPGGLAAPLCVLPPSTRWGQPERPKLQEGGYGWNSAARGRTPDSTGAGVRSTARRGGHCARALAALRLNLLAAAIPAARSQSAPPHVTAS